MNTTPLFFGNSEGLQDYTSRTLGHDRTNELLCSMATRRRELGFTRRDLAEKLGVSSEMVRSLEIGRRRPSEKLEFKLRKLLDLP